MTTNKKNNSNLSFKCPECFGIKTEDIDILVDAEAKSMTLACTCGHCWNIKYDIGNTSPPKTKAWVEEEGTIVLKLERKINGIDKSVLFFVDDSILEDMPLRLRTFRYDGHCLIEEIGE